MPPPPGDFVFLRSALVTSGAGGWLYILAHLVLGLNLGDQVRPDFRPYFPTAGPCVKTIHYRGERRYNLAHIAPAHGYGSHFLVYHSLFLSGLLAYL